MLLWLTAGKLVEGIFVLYKASKAGLGDTTGLLCRGYVYPCGLQQQRLCFETVTQSAGHSQPLNVGCWIC